jgi:hypothetical protein
MFIKSQDLIKAISKISYIASLDKKQPGILLDVHNDTVDVYYNSNYKAVITTIPAVVEEGEYHGKAIFDYGKLTSVTDVCKGSGEIRVDDVEIVLNVNPDGSGIADFNVTQLITIASDDESFDRVVGSNTYKLSWWSEEKATTKQRALLQSADSWSAEKLSNMLKTVTDSDARVVYVSSHYQGAFSVNTHSAVLSNTDNVFNKSFQIPSSSAKAITSILGAIESDDIFVGVIDDAEGNPFAILVFDSDKTTSVYMSICEKSGAHLRSIQRCHEFGYDDYQFVIRTSVLQSSLKAAIGVEGGVNCKLEFVQDEDGIECIITAVNTGSSTDNTYRITCDGFNSGIADEFDDGPIIVLNANLKIISDIVSKNKNAFTGFDIQSGENNKSYIRIGFLDLAKAGAARAAYMESKGIEEMTTADKLAIRKDYIDGCYYMTLDNA